ncbi:hypothetical protein EYF80_019325 [Liparis tanakae]|uniref:Uncharacterized protein n=1 Tax=Liparis tanakae TaxID=230148 RepID=A0A4Z2HXQ7_9TELE|nr:hypothetical protein EYF80_019325 [Liparis tanakae]
MLIRKLLDFVPRQPAVRSARPLAYLDAVQQFAHAPEAVGLDVPQSLFRETGHVKVLHFLLWRRQKRDKERE